LKVSTAQQFYTANKTHTFKIRFIDNDAEATRISRRPEYPLLLFYVPTY